MTVDVVWWDLAGSGRTIESLQEDLRHGAVELWQDVEGLRLKLWIADPEHDRWGAIMWWTPDRPTDQPLPPNRAAELIGAPPTHRTQFEVVAVTGSLGPPHPPCPSADRQRGDRCTTT
jgi:hypothetical protein